MQNLLSDLNPEQRLAAETLEGPVLILAGAGTGKTRAITFRMANLLSQGVPAEAILGVTFTNKAAEQMQERLRDLLLRSGMAPATPWLSTYHSLCARLLRREWERAGLPRSFSVFDDDDQIAALKLAMTRMGLNEERMTPRSILGRISYAKNQGRSAEEIRASAVSDEDRRIARIYEAYEDQLRRSSALDFDDLLLRAVRVLKDSADVRRAWQSRFQYLQVDEYQDTNRLQYDLLRLLSGDRKNVCVVGDEDQSIYRWRGADVGILLRFTLDFPDARVIRLERNYRSTQIILDASSAVVSCNSNRLGKSLSSELGPGSNVRFYEARDAQAEAEYISGEIARILREDSQENIAVEYRTGAQSRAFEEALRRIGIRYRIIGGFNFYNRAEIKDILAYVRLSMQPEDDIALLRVINVPARGIGKTTVDQLRQSAQRDGISLWKAIESHIASNTTGRAVAPLRVFRELILGLQERPAQDSAPEFLHAVLDQTRYLEMVSQREAPDEASRMENIEELLRAVADSAEAGETLLEFLDKAALVSGDDALDLPAVNTTLTTLHGTKGLEFDHVFLTGLEEGIFPHSRANNSTDELEEERRLCYVGMTRARKSLTLTRAVYRRVFGDEQRLRASLPSRFLSEIPAELVDTIRGSLVEFGESRRYEPDPEYSYTPEEFVRRVRSSSPRHGESAGGRPSARRPESGSASPSARRASGGENPLIGQKVRHPSFGVGTIIAVEGDEDDRRLSISFPGRGTKKLIERYAQLEPA